MNNLERKIKHGTEQQQFFVYTYYKSPENYKLNYEEIPCIHIWFSNFKITNTRKLCRLSEETGSLTNVVGIYER